VLGKILGWNPKIITIFGVPLHLHISFLLFVAYFCVFIPSLVFYIIGAFVGVAIHEYGHILAAKYFGIDTKKVILCPLGGVALLEKMPRNPMQEFCITAAGPLTSLLLSIWCLALGVITYKVSQFFVVMAILNAGMFVFNCLPLGVMDGGRMLRATLQVKYTFAEATKITFKVSLAFFALIMVVAIINFDIMLMLTMCLVMMFTYAENSRNA